MDRNSQREKVAIAEHDIYSSEPEPFYEMFPEPYGNSVFADAVAVLVGCYKSKVHLQWILEKGKYNIRFGGEREGAIELKESYLRARYLLLYDPDDFSDLLQFQRSEICFDRISLQQTIISFRHFRQKELRRFIADQFQNDPDDPVLAEEVFPAEFISF